MKYTSIKSFWWEESNCVKINEIQLLDSTIISKMSKSLNNDSTANIDCIDMILPFDSYELLIIKFWSLEAKISLKFLLLFFYNNCK
jgi:hypothetical protein